MAGPARWVDQRGRNSLGVSLPEGQLTLVAGRRVLVDKQGKVVSVAEEEAPLTGLALVKDAGKAVIVGLAGNEVWRFNDAKGSGVLIATLSAPSSDISRVSADGKLIRVQKRGIGPSEVWLNLEGERVEAPQAAPTPEPENKPDLGDSPVLRWVSQAWQAPLIAAVADGLRIGPERALVVSGPDLFEIDLKTGLPVAARALGGDSSASRLTRLQRRGDQEFAFASHAQRSGYWISPSTPTSLMELRWPSVFSGLAEIKLQSVEQPAAAKSPPVISSSGAVLWHLPCREGEMAPAAAVARMQLYGMCVRQPDGSLKSVFAHTNRTGPDILATPMSGGGLAMLAESERVGDRMSYALFGFDSESTPSVIARLPEETSTRTGLDELRPGQWAGFIRLRKEGAGARRIDELEFVRVVNGKASSTAFGMSKPSTKFAYNAGYAAVSIANEYRISTDGGLTWRSLPRPSIHGRSMDDLVVGELGLADDGFVRLGWAEALDGELPKVERRTSVKTVDAQSPTVKPK